MTRVAIVTGAASGIGLALSRALVGRGDIVVAADIDVVGAERTARDLTATGPGHATSAEVDVRDAEAVASLVSRTAAREGRLDLMVNNAGIGVGGEVHELTLDHWDRVIDVNLRGVVHGVHAAYPLMVEQRHGHIVNTASLAGLIASPLLAPYSATKHAVVGLSLALRAEAAAYGVGVTAVCPGFVDTPILDGGPADLPPTRLSSRSREMANRFAMGRLYPPDRLARDVLAGVERNRALVVAPAQARLAWRLNRLAPRLVAAITTRQIAHWIRQPDPVRPVERADGALHG
jgi:NAD(P)-dependent dehydrogenase (short-subunit alcohol dehydrogenase family)